MKNKIGSYYFIINPKSNRKVGINTPTGRQILMNYINNLNGSGLDENNSYIEDIKKILPPEAILSPDNGYYYINYGDSLNYDNVSNGFQKYLANCIYNNEESCIACDYLNCDKESLKNTLIMFDWGRPLKNNAYKRSIYETYFNTHSKSDLAKKRLYNLFKKEIECSGDLNSLALCTLKNIYKIHLQPSENFISYYIQNILHLYKTNQEFQNAICGIKIVEDYTLVYTENFPVIVIYPSYSPEDSTIELNNTAYIIDCLKTNIEFLEDSSNGIIPRYNHPIGNTKNILFIGNGDGDVKQNLFNYENENPGIDKVTPYIFEDIPEYFGSFVKGSQFLERYYDLLI